MATTYDKASLVLIPSGTKEGVVFSQKPTNGDGDFTFSRSTSATRVGPSGYIEKETQNLLLQSNQFDTTWATINASVTGGQSGYDGSNNAWLLDITSGTDSQRLEQNITASHIATFSAYAKAATLNWIRLRTDGATTRDVYYDLQNGIIGNNSGIDAQIESVGGGWYRCSIVTNDVTRVRFYPADGDADVTHTSGSIYIQDAQLEQGLVARDYIETTTSAVYGGITDNIPRLDYNGSCPSLLLEPQRTNLFTNSEYIDGWSNAGGTSSQNSTDSTSPEGLYNSAVLDASSVRYQTFSISSSAHSYSVYAKAKSGSILGLRIDTPTTKDTYFNLSDGTIQSTGSGHTASIEAVGNGWYRCIISFTDSIVNAVLETTSSGSVYIWGAQLEQGSYATSYIPTYGSAAVTRNEDDMDTTYSTAISTDGGATFFIELDGAPNTNNNSTGFNFAQEFASGDVISYNKNSGDFHRIRVGANYFASSITKENPVKMAAVVTSTSASVYANGELVNTLSHTRNWSSATNLQTAITDAIGVLPVKQYILFPTALTSSEAIAITTL